jgi:hypothetical protein
VSISLDVLSQATCMNKNKVNSRDFPNLDTIQRSIADLHRKFPGTELLGLQFPSSLSPAIVDASQVGDPIRAVEQIVGAMLHHFHLPAASVAVKFNDGLEVPARISETQGGGRLVEMQTAYMVSPDLVAILAHEVAHFFLDTSRLRYAITLENEVLTDTTANYLGAGWSVLNAYRKSVSTSEERVFGGRVVTTTTSVSKLGYLTPQEFGYVIARRCRVTNEHIVPWIHRAEGRAAFSAGVAQLNREVRQPPLATAGVPLRIRYKIAVWRSRRKASTTAHVFDYGAYAIESGTKISVRFRCPQCTQQLRIPVGVKHAVVTCKVCKKEFDCSS